MSEAVQLEQNEPVASANSQPAPASTPFSSDKYRPGQDRPADDELYAFRTAMAQAAEQETPKPKAPKANLIGLIVVACLVGTLLVIGGMTIFKAKSPNLYIDLGSQRYDPAGLGGRLIAQWSGSATYKFTVDPLDPSQVAGFRAVVANPPHAITFTLRLKDATDHVACQKDIVIPGSSRDAAAPDQALASRSTATGDTMQNAAGSNGQIGETVITGSLACNLDAYRRIVAWDFSTDFPPLATQSAWLKHEDAVAPPNQKSKPGGARASRGSFALIKSLPAPLEADDVIVSDNPTLGIVATSGGHAFLVGSSVLTNPALDWQVFPAEVHYRCEKNAMCMVTHLNSRSAVRARLMR